MSHTAADFFRDAREMAGRAQTCAALDYDIFAEGTEARYSAVYCLIVVGEALNNVPTEVRALAPAIEWRAIVSMRHVLVHAYWRTDYAVVHEVLRRDLAPLIGAIDHLLPLIEGKMTQCRYWSKSAA